MVRLVIFLVFFAALTLAATSVLRFIAALRENTALPPVPRHGPNHATEATMPAILRNTAYGLLLALMIGITTGWLGGL